MPSKQLKVLRALTELLEGINPTNEDPETLAPYTVDLRNKVFRGRTTLGANVTMPALALLEAPTPVESLHAGKDSLTKLEGWRLLLQGFAADDQINPTDPAYDLKALVERRLSRVIETKQHNGEGLFPEHYLLGKLLTDLKILQGVVRPPEEKISATAFFYIPLVVGLTTNASRPNG